MTKHKIIRVGDTVQITNPMFVKRVGYPKTSDDFLEEARKTLSEYKLINIKPFSKLLASNQTYLSKEEEDFVRKYAIVLLKRNGFGGKERSLHLYSRPELIDTKAVVVGKKTAKTGFYVPPSYIYSYDGEHDFDPGGLAEEKTHVLLNLDVGCFRLVGEPSFPTHAWEEKLIIPSYCTQKVIDPEN